MLNNIKLTSFFFFILAIHMFLFNPVSRPVVLFYLFITFFFCVCLGACTALFILGNIENWRHFFEYGLNK